MAGVIPHLFRVGRDFATENLTPGKRVYGERLVKQGGRELRVWDHKRSKLASSMVKGLTPPLRENMKILYLGVSSGTTASHISDIVTSGVIYGVDPAPRVLREFYLLSLGRKNLVPILANASKPEEYASIVPQVDMLYQDVAQPNQSYILTRNAQLFLKPKGIALMMIKSRSIDVSKNPHQVFAEELKKLRAAGFKVLAQTTLEPFERDHLAVLMEWK